MSRVVLGFRVQAAPPSHSHGSVLSILALMLKSRSGPGGRVVALELATMTTRATARSATTSTTLNRRKGVSIEAATTTQTNQDRNRRCHLSVGTLGELFSQLHRVIASVKHE